MSLKRVVIFDLYGTLVDENAAGTFSKLPSTGFIIDREDGKLEPV